MTETFRVRLGGPAAKNQMEKIVVGKCRSTCAAKV
jgi:hypothetical protein